MAVTLAKLIRPDSGNALLRERLFIQLDTACQRPLVWVSAPAGSGKTTLVSSFLGHRDIKNLWYQVDGGDADMATFFHYFGQALKSATRTRKKMPTLTPEYQNGLPEFSRNYFREVFKRLTPPTCIVLDNFQEAGPESDLNQLLPSVLDETPKGINVVILSRSDPPSSFARLRANQQLSQIDWADLQFTVDEELAIARQRYPHRQITRQQLQKLNTHIQGWVTGLILLLEHEVELDTVTFDAEDSNQEHLFDYFASEIFSKINLSTRQFLIKTALLPKMSVSISKTLSGNSAAKKILSGLVRRQYFTVRHGLWNPTYEYHPLFRKFLQNQARALLADEDYKILENNAGLLLAEAGDIDYAASLFRSGENWPALGKLILKHAKQKIEAGRNRQVSNWIQALPDKILNEQPWLLYWLGQSTLQCNPISARRALTEAFGLFEKEGSAKGLYLSWAAVVESYLLAWDTFTPLLSWVEKFDKLQKKYPGIPGLETKARVALARFSALFHAVPEHSELQYWTKKTENIFRLVPIKSVRAMVGGQLAYAYLLVGNTHKAKHTINILRPLRDSNEVSPLIRLFLFVSDIGLNILNGDINQLEDNCRIGQVLAKESGINFFDVAFQGYLVILGLMKDDLLKSEEHLKLLERYLKFERKLDHTYYEYLTARVNYAKGEVDAAYDSCHRAYESSKALSSIFSEYGTLLLLAQITIKQGRINEGLKHLNEVLIFSNRSNSTLYLYFAYSLRAWALLLQSNTLDADLALKQAFSIGKKQHYFTSWLWNPDLIRKLCSRAIAQEIEIDYSKALIKKFKLLPENNEAQIDHRWPWPVKIYTLGRFGIVINDQAIDAKSRPFDLLKVLLAYGGRDVHEEKLMDALWPESDGDQAQASFKTTLHRLRKALGDADILLLKNHQLSLNEQFVWVDIWVMSRLFADVELSITVNNSSQNTELTKKLMQRYCGHFLANEPATWAIHKREALRLQFIRQSTALVRSFHCDDHKTAIACYQRLLEIDPLIEEAYQGLIHCYQAQGKQDEAVASYQKCVHVLKASNGVMPSYCTTKLIQSYSSKST